MTATATPTMTATATTTATANPEARIHNLSPNSFVLFIRITFTNSTTYDQAVALLGSGPFPTAPDPWGCDDPRSPTPPPNVERESAYDGSHTLLIDSTPWDELLWLASSPQVVSVDAAAVYQCP